MAQLLRNNVECFVEVDNLEERAKGYNSVGCELYLTQLCIILSCCSAC